MCFFFSLFQGYALHLLLRLSEPYLNTLKQPVKVIRLSMGEACLILTGAIL